MCDSSNIRKKNPTPTLSKSGWERGAGNRNRTGTDFTPRDFKSLVSTYSTMPASFRYRSIIFLFRQGKNPRKEVHLEISQAFERKEYFFFSPCVV